MLVLGASAYLVALYCKHLHVSVHLLFIFHNNHFDCLALKQRASLSFWIPSEYEMMSYRNKTHQGRIWFDQIWSQLGFLLLFSVRVCPFCRFCPTFKFSALFHAGFCWHACLKTQQQPIKRLNLQESSQFFSQKKTTEGTT